MADANQALLIFDDFLTHLRRQGFDIGVDDYLRLQELLHKAGTECAPQQLKTRLCPIFATSKAQQEQFYHAFDDYFGLFQPIAATTTPRRPVEEVLVPAKQQIRPARSRKSFYVLGVAVLVMVACAAVIWRGWHNQTTSTQDNSQPAIPTQTQWAPQPSVPQSAGTRAATQTSPIANTTSSTTSPSRYERYTSGAKYLIAVFYQTLHGLTVLWLAILAPVLLFLLYDQPLQRDKLASKFYEQVRPLLAWLAILTQPLLWSAFPDLAELGWFKDSSTLLPILASLIFFLFYRQTSLSTSVKRERYERFRLPILCLALLASLTLFLYGLMIHWAAILTPIVFFFIYEWHRYKHRQLLLQKQRGKKPPFVWPIRIKAFAPRLFDSELFYQAARLMRRRQTGENYRLDIDASVAATTEARGYPTFRYKLDTKPPEYLILIDRASSRDHQAQLFNELTEALEREGIFVTRYFYEADPRVCFQETGSDCLSLLELHSKFGGHRLLIFGDGEKLLDPITGTLTTWSTIISGWPDRALLTPTPPAQWGFREISLAALFIVLPASLAGLLTLVTHFESLTETDVRRWRAGNTETVPSLEFDPVDLVGPLRAYLGEPTFQWLCACGVYPELQWDLTLYLGSLPVMGGDLISEENLLRLIRLAWFRSGSIPDEMRWLLLHELDPARERAIRLALIELLERDPPPPETYAADAYQFNLVVQRWLSRRDRRRRRELLAALQTTPRQQLTRDYTVLRLLEAAPPSALNVYLPVRLRRVFYHNGIPAFGLRTSMRLLMVLLIIGMGLVAREYARQFVYSPLPLSEAHARTTLNVSPAIAKQPAANSCSACHSLQTRGMNVTSINANCAACHQTDAFAATVTAAHAEAGIGCAYCHIEHRGRDFRPDLAPISADFQPDINAEHTCVGCHNDNNHHLYNGRSVHTPHGGTLGYPVVNGQWVWKGLDRIELAVRPEIVASLKRNNVTPEQTQQWRNSQFHALHLFSTLSCDRCHKSGYMGANVDRVYPRVTCAECHNGYTDSRTARKVLAADQPDCISCHVQHPRDTGFRNPALLASDQNTMSSLPTPTVEQRAQTPAANTTPGYSKFSHSSPKEHADLMGRSNCGSCHPRIDGSLAPRFPVHKDCTGCHLAQFAQANGPICFICHTNAESTSPPVKDFPPLQTFNTTFDHERHKTGAARPANGCVACHQIIGSKVLSTVRGLNAHAACYACHSSGKEAAQVATCGACHSLGADAQ